MSKRLSLILFVLFNISFFFKNYNEIYEKIIDNHPFAYRHFEQISYDKATPYIILPISDSAIKYEQNITVEDGYYGTTNFEETYPIY